MVIPGMSDQDFKFFNPSYSDPDIFPFDLYRLASSNSDNSEFCNQTGTNAIPDNQVNVYTLKEDITAFIVCTDLENTYDYTGFATVLDIDANSTKATDDLLWYVVANGTFSVYGIFTRNSFN